MMCLRLCALFLLAAPVFAQVQLKTVRVASGLTKPVFVTAPRTDHQRLFIVEQTGRIKILANGVVLATPFLDLSTQLTSAAPEQGLLGLAFHPNYSSNGKLYVFYTRVGDGALVVAQYTVTANPDVADPNGAVLLAIPHSAGTTHNAGCLQFGPDGYLYVSTGDGSDIPPGNSTCIAQDGQELLGKILRLDVDNAPPYAIPPSNPFVGNAAFLPEIWDLGLRNPWRFCFDRLTGDMYLGDAGQSDQEEFDFEPAGSAGGVNYGWKIMEGTICFDSTGCASAPPCGSPLFTAPVWTFGHVNSQCAGIGGCIYRGRRIPSLAGTYFFADYCSARIWSFVLVNGVVTQFTNRTQQLAPGGGLFINVIASFGEDADGELYICDRGGEIFEIAPVDDCALNPYCSSTLNSSGAAATIGATGSASVCSNDLVLAVSGLPSNVPGLFFYGATPIDPGVPFANGLRCVASPTQRLPIVMSSASGVATYACDLTAFPLNALGPADARYFQFWFRDAAAGGAGTNTSNGLEVVLCN